MTSSKPYLLRALYEWITDNEMTPYIIVDAARIDVVVPKKYVKNGKIILNISFMATQNLRLGNDALEGDAKFGGNNFRIYIPIAAVLAIYAQESGQGMTFPPEEILQPAPEEKPPTIEIPESEKDKIIPFRPKAKS